MQTNIEKAKHIKLLLLDVDGVLTDGRIYYGDNGIKMRAFHVHDGLGIRLLQNAGIAVGVISAKNSHHVRERLESLQIQHIFLGNEDKLACYETIKSKLQLTDTQIAYMGDDVVDLPIIFHAGLTATTSHASDFIKQKTDIVTVREAGKGAVREFCEFILTAQNKLDDSVQSYLMSVERV